MSGSRLRASELGEDGMDIDSPESSSTVAHSPDLAILVRDTPKWLSNMKALKETDVIILLTPVVIPISQDPEDIGDPFEPLGRSIAARHARVRHIPYTRRNGITSTHLGFIKRGHVIILCLALKGREEIPIELGDTLFAVSDNKPSIIVVCCNDIESQTTLPFPTVIQTAGYAPPALEATAALIFGEVEAAHPINASSTHMHDGQHHKGWGIEEWKETRDICSVSSLWHECIDGRFAMNEKTLASLIRRPGYAKHYVAKSQDSLVRGFCATFLSYVDQDGEELIASIALILVSPSSRNQGIGVSLLNHAITELKKTRGVTRLQLGSNFPRILYGPLTDNTRHDEWLRRRGWVIDNDLPGQGLVVHDLILNIRDWKYVAPPTPLKFRPARQEDMRRILQIVDKTQTELSKMGWYDQYFSLMNGPNVKDVMVGTNANDIVAVALTYIPSCGSQVASNLPWAGLIGSDVGGVTCICVTTTSKDDIRNCLLDACIKTLQERGMGRILLDGITEGAESLMALNFQTWARYRDVWKAI